MILTRLLLPPITLAALYGCQAETQTLAGQSPVPSCRQPQGPDRGPAARSPFRLKVAPLQIQSGSRTHRFDVEVAQSGEEQERGLMFRDSLGPDKGMLFPFPYPRPARFWMMNTMIPLDLIFIRSDGSIARVAVNASPHCLDGVESGEPVAAVLEIAGGRSVELGIAAGDRVSWAGFPGN